MRIEEQDGRIVRIFGPPGQEFIDESSWRPLPEPPPRRRNSHQPDRPCRPSSDDYHGMNFGDGEHTLGSLGRHIDASSRLATGFRLMEAS